MSQSPVRPPIVQSLPAGFSITKAFGKLAALPGRLWLDSASQPKDLPASDFADLGRYSFLTADPVDRLVASVDDANPWPQLNHWCRQLPADQDPSLPPFQGGIAGIIGYEAGAWLENVGVPTDNDLPTPAMSLGWYDWTIAIDHHSGKALLICRGDSPSTGPDESKAKRRADQISSILGDCITAPQQEEQRHAEVAEVNSNFTSDEFQAAVAEVVRRIRDGDSFQVNLAQRLVRKANQAAAELYQRLRVSNPAPFGGFYDGSLGSAFGDEEFAVLSSSPEGFLTLRDRVVQTRPIKGTIRRGDDKASDADLARQLSASEKDRAENVMIVDLMRNDLSRVCEDDSVQVLKLCEIERYQFVQHLVSVVEGRLRSECSVVDLLQACFPGGSVTGAPKIEAMRTIAELEPNPRGPYCGSMGYISSADVADFNILIRTITAAGGHWQIPVGGGITARSKPAAEEAETWAKAEGMLRAISETK